MNAQICFSSIFLTLTMFTSLAFGQVTQTKEESYPKLPKASFEIKPLTTMASTIPGIGAFGATAEANLDPKWATFIGGTYTDVDLSDDVVTRSKVSEDVAFMKAGYGYVAELGLRYYENPIGHSVYGGTSGAYSEVHGKWQLADELYDTRMFAFVPTLFAGYRWAWVNGILMRLEAGVSVPRVANKDITQVAAAVVPNTEAEDKIDQALTPATIPRIDFSIGYQL